MNYDHPMMTTLNHIKTITGISRNHLSEILKLPAAFIATIEDAPIVRNESPVSVENLYDDFLIASDALDDADLYWDKVVPERIAAMKLGVSAYVLRHMMARRNLLPWDFGLLGNWVNVEDIETCRRPA